MNWPHPTRLFHHSITSLSAAAHQSLLTHSINPLQIYSRVSLSTECPSEHYKSRRGPSESFVLDGSSLLGSQWTTGGGGGDSSSLCAGAAVNLTAFCPQFQWVIIRSGRSGSDLRVDSSVEIWAYPKVTGRRITLWGLGSNSCSPCGARFFAFLPPSWKSEAAFSTCEHKAPTGKWHESVLIEAKSMNSQYFPPNLIFGSSKAHLKPALFSQLHND